MAPAASSFGGNSWLVKVSLFDTLGSNQLFLPLIFEKPAWLSDQELCHVGCYLVS
jgi:hypothetical protein